MVTSRDYSTMNRIAFPLLIPLALSVPLVAEPLADIRYHAIVEAPVKDVWSIVSERAKLEKWLFLEVRSTDPDEAGTYSVIPFGRDVVRVRILEEEAPAGRVLSWPAPATKLALEVRSIDEYLTMLSLSHTNWPQTDDDEIIKRHAELEQRWLVAMMKLHRLFPPAVVDTKMFRPSDVGGLFVKANLVINGDFEYAEKGRFEGVSFGWETNTAKSSPEVHRIDDQVSNDRGRSQCIQRPPDWSNYVIQQWTPEIEPLIKPGHRYRLSGWVRAEGIENPAGWYRLGLWFMDAENQPIGDFLKNEKVTDAEGGALLNHDWRQYVIEATAPKGARRAVVILSGHWDEHGTVWYDDVRLWDAGPRPTTRAFPAASSPHDSQRPESGL